MPDDPNVKEPAALSQLPGEGAPGAQPFQRTGPKGGPASASGRQQIRPVYPLAAIAQLAFQSGLSLSQLRDAVSRAFIEFALDFHSGNQCKAAKDLGLHRNTLARQMALLKIQPPRHWNGGYQSHTVREGGCGESPEPLSGASEKLDRMRPVNADQQASRQRREGIA